MVAGVRAIPAQAAGVLSYAEPVTAAGVGWLAFGEAIGPMGLLGVAAVVALGAWVATEPSTPPSTYVSSAISRA